MKYQAPHCLPPGVLSLLLVNYKICDRILKIYVVDLFLCISYLACWLQQYYAVETLFSQQF